MNLLRQTLSALRAWAAQAATASRDDAVIPRDAGAADLQARMAAQARNSMGLMSISGR